MPTLEQIVAQYYPVRKMVGRVYLPDLSPLEGMATRFFVYAAPLFVLNPLQTLQQGVVVGHDCFLWGLTGNGVLQSDGVTPTAFRVLLRDGRTRQLLTQKAVANNSILGTGQDPFFLRELHAIPSMRQIDVQVVDLSGLASTVQVCLCTAIAD